MPRKTQFTPEETIETATALAREGGWKEFSVKTVAKRIGSSTMPIYSQFESLDRLKDAVVVRGWDVLMDYEARMYTGDVWVDQSIGYLNFATDEHNLFQCMFDGRNVELQRKKGFENWIYLLRMLEEYEGFKGMEPEQVFLVRYSRAVFTHGLAASISTNLWGKMLEIPGMIENVVVAGSHALLEGYRKTYDRSNSSIAFLDTEISRMIELGSKKLEEEERKTRIE